MTENLRLVLDLLALAAFGYAILKGTFKAGSDTADLKKQVQLHTKWIADHEECNQKQIEILNEVRENLAYLRGRFDSEQEQ